MGILIAQAHWEWEFKLFSNIRYYFQTPQYSSYISKISISKFSLKLKQPA